MITINHMNNEQYKDSKLINVFGFSLDNGYGFVDVDSNYLVMFWKLNTTCEVYPLEDYGVYDDSTLNDLITKLHICEMEDVKRVFMSEKDFTLNLIY